MEETVAAEKREEAPAAVEDLARLAVRSGSQLGLDGWQGLVLSESLQRELPELSIGALEAYAVADCGGEVGSEVDPRVSALDQIGSRLEVVVEADVAESDPVVSIST